jgi:tetratricopeptide (TPR) repeat protein
MINENRASLFLIISKALLALKQPKLALSILNNAMRYHPDDRELNLLLGRALADLGAWEKILIALENYIENHPDDFGFIYILGSMLLSQYYHEEALQHFERILKHKEEQKEDFIANIYALKGYCLLLSRQFKKAEEAFEICRETLPWNLNACKGIIELYRSTNRHDEIEIFLKNFIDEYPNLYPPYFWLAHHIHYYLHNPKESKIWYADAVERSLDKENRIFCDVYWTSDKLHLYMLDDYIQALLECEENELALITIRATRGKRIFSNSEIYTKRKANYFLKTGNLALAKKIVQRYPNLLKKSPVLKSMQARIYAEMGELEEARKISEEALSFELVLFEALEVKADILMKQNMWEMAIEILQQLLQRAFLSPDWLMKIAECYVQSGQPEEAISAYKEVVELDPKDANAWAALGKLFSELRKVELTKSAYKEALKYDWLSTSNREESQKALEKLEH